MNSISAVAEYEKKLLGQRASYSVSSKKDSPQKKEANAICIFKYAFETIMGWSPEQIRDHITMELIEWLDLGRAYRKIKFPPELDKEKDLFYIAAVMYPDIVHYSRKERVLSVYQKVLDRSLIKFPKMFFDGEDGRTALKYCFIYYVQQNLYTLTNEQLYEYFSDKSRADRFITKGKLKNHICKQYTHVIDLLHETLPADDQSELYYMFYRFRYEVNITRKKIKKENPNESLS